jgi:hypothetical protein
MQYSSDCIKGSAVLIIYRTLYKRLPQEKEPIAATGRTVGRLLIIHLYSWCANYTNKDSIKK